MRVYLDTAPIIYLLDVESPFHAAARKRFLELRSTEDSSLHASLLLPMELLARVPDYQMLYAIWEEMRSKIKLELYSIDAEIIARAHGLIASTQKHRSLKLADAIHLATAQAAGCTHFFTNDKRLPALKGLEMVWVG